MSLDIDQSVYGLPLTGGYGSLIVHECYLPPPSFSTAGVVHLEALELLSKECESKVR